jgi:hypothetical protein
MDIKKNRRDAVVTGQVIDMTEPMVEGMYPGANGRDKKGHGNATSDNNIGWDMRAQSMQRGADTDYLAIDREKREQDKRFGVPCDDNFPAPSDPAGPKNCGARYQTASYNGDDTLPNPNNFSSNPGFMSTSEMTTAGNPGNGSTSQITTNGAAGAPRGSLPRTTNFGGAGKTGGGVSGSTGDVSTLPGDVDNRQDGGPQVISSGYNG